MSLKLHRRGTVGVGGGLDPCWNQSRMDRLPGPICGGDTEAVRHWDWEQSQPHGQKLKVGQRCGFEILGRSMTISSWRKKLLNWLKNLFFFFKSRIITILLSRVYFWNGACACEAACDPHWARAISNGALVTNNEPNACDCRQERCGLCSIWILMKIKTDRHFEAVRTQHFSGCQTFELN